MKAIHLIVSLAISLPLIAQQTLETMDGLPFREIDEYPDDYSANLVAARMVDGLGFRYYWATEGLRSQDLAHRPTAGARSCQETLEHILGLSNMIAQTIRRMSRTSSNNSNDSTFAAMRRETLLNLQEASEILKKNGPDLTQYKIVFKRGDRRNEFPFWNLINGPIADALWHVGQVVSHRRTSGNPWNAKVSLLSGTVRD